MPKYMTVKFVCMLTILLCLSFMFHYVFIGSVLNCFILDTACNSLIQMFSLYIIEPVICIFIAVGFVNKEEAKYYDTFI